MRRTVAGKGARTRGPIVGDARASVWSNDMHVKIHQAFAGTAGAGSADAMGRVTGRAGEAGVDVRRMLPEAGVGDDLAEVMALRAESIGTVRAQVGIGIQVCDQLARHDGLAGFVTAFQNMGESGTVRPVRTGAPEFPIVIAVVAIGAEDAVSHQTAFGRAVKIEHVAQQTWLRKRATAVMHDRVAGTGGAAEWGNYIQRIRGGSRPGGRISVDSIFGLTCARAVAAQASLILIHRRDQSGLTIGRTDPNHPQLRRTHRRRRSERSYSC